MKGSKGEENVQKKQRREKMPYNLKQMIVKKIYQVASGDWTPHLQVMLFTPLTLSVLKICILDFLLTLVHFKNCYTPFDIKSENKETFVVWINITEC